MPRPLVLCNVALAHGWHWPSPAHEAGMRTVRSNLACCSARGRCLAHHPAALPARAAPSRISRLTSRAFGGVSTLSERVRPALRRITWGPRPPRDREYRGWEPSQPGISRERGPPWRGVVTPHPHGPPGGVFLGGCILSLTGHFPELHFRGGNFPPPREFRGSPRTPSPGAPRGPRTPPSRSAYRPASRERI